MFKPIVGVNGQEALVFEAADRNGDAITSGGLADAAFVTDDSPRQQLLDGSFLDLQVEYQFAYA